MQRVFLDVPGGAAQLFLVALSLLSCRAQAPVGESTAAASQPADVASAGPPVSAPSRDEASLGAARCLRWANCQCWDGCVLASELTGTVRLRPDGPPVVEGTWYRIVAGRYEGSTVVLAPVCLLDAQNHRTDTCFETLDQPTCTGACFPEPPGYDCLRRDSAGQDSCEAVPWQAP